MTKGSHRNDATTEAPEPESRWHALPTEARHPGSGDLDALSSEQIVALLLEEDSRGLAAARRNTAAIARAAEWVADSLGEGGTLMFAGAGTSGRLGVLEAAECPPTFGTDPERIRAVIAGGPDAVFRAAEGAEDREDDGRASVRDLGPSDVLIGLSASSVTAFARGALAQARQQGARTILVTCASEENLGDVADLNLALDTGPEVLTGSTRLKAGSATKAVLNAITTAAMVRLGKVFGNLMVDLRPGSAKLRDRSVRIISAAAGVPADEARDLYRAAGREIKTAIVMARCKVTAEAARERLGAAGGHVRVAIASASPGSRIEP